MKHERIQALVKLNRLEANYKALQKLSGNQWVIPMIKANAYGHGAQKVAKKLFKQKGLLGLGVATLDEGSELRKHSPQTTNRKNIIVFSNDSPWTSKMQSHCSKYNLSPVLYRLKDLKKFIQTGAHRKLNYHIQFNTGMNRLGIEMHELETIRKMLSGITSSFQPQGILTHLATAEKPSHPLSRKQLKRFESVVTELSSISNQTLFHMANSAALWNHRHWRLKKLTQCIRPGLALYGVTPWQGANKNGIRPVMSLKSKITQFHDIEAGEGLGYGFDFRSLRKTRVAIVGAGYGDGVPRILGGRGSVAYNNQRCQILGRMSMDLMAIHAPKSLQGLKWIELFGDSMPIWEQAQNAKTIPYELMTSLTNRVPRFYSQ